MTCWWWSVRRAGAKRPGDRPDPDRRRPVRRSPNRRAAAADPGRARGPPPTASASRLFNVLAARMDFAGAVGARPLRRLGRARHRGAVARGGVGDVRRVGPACGRRHHGQPRHVGNRRVPRCAAASVAAVVAGGADRPADLVFADPPYELPAADVEAVLAALADRGWVAHGAIAVVERAASGPTLAWPAGWTPGRDRRYGDTRLEFGDFGRRAPVHARKRAGSRNLLHHEWRRMPGIVRSGDPRPHRRLRARGRPVRRGRGGGAGESQQAGHVHRRRAHRDDRGVHVAPAEPAGRDPGRASSSTSSTPAG